MSNDKFLKMTIDFDKLVETNLELTEDLRNLQDELNTANEKISDLQERFSTIEHNVHDLSQTVYTFEIKEMDLEMKFNAHFHKYRDPFALAEPLVGVLQEASEVSIPVLHGADRENIPAYNQTGAPEPFNYSDQDP